MTLQWPTVTYKVTHSDPKMTYIDPTHLLLPLPTSTYLIWTINSLILEIKRSTVEGGGGKVGQPNLV